MCARIAIVYNEPLPGKYQSTGEEKAVLGVMESVNAVKKSLIELNYEVFQIPLALPIEQAYERLNALPVDVVFNLFEGFPGFPETEVLIPKFLAEKGTIFTGCSSKSLKLALDKVKTKEVLINAGIRTPAYQLLKPETVSSFNLEYPCIVKPSAEDASHGLTEDSLVFDYTALIRQINLICSYYGGQALIEEFVNGKEFNATVLGNIHYTVLPISEIAYNLPPNKPRILTFAAKWDQESFYYRNTPVICPAIIDNVTKNGINQVTLEAFQLIIGQGYARVDMRLDSAGNVNVIEVNPNPDISPNAGAARQANAAGMNYTQFIEKIIFLALEKREYGN